MSKQYEAVIGLEIHVQVNTMSKAFNSDRNAFSDKANRHIGPITLAHPGTLPYHNKRAFRQSPEASHSMQQ